MKNITDHIVAGDSANHQLKITVPDAPGSGGAHHIYAITWNDDQPPSPENLCLVLFQNGPIKEVGVNGVTHEALLAIVIDRLRSFQAGPYACQDNADALEHAKRALWYLQKRTEARIARGIEGTHEK